MKSIFAIAKQTFREGIRMRIVIVFLVALGFIVLRLPFALKGDETLTGRLQNFLDYSLGAVGLLLSLTTIMLSTSTLAQEFKTKTLHMVVTKPISRFQIILGKWVGVNLLNLLILGLCAIAIFAFAVLIKNSRQQTTEIDRDLVSVRDTVWTARTAAQPDRPDFFELAKREVAEKIERGEIDRGRAIDEIQTVGMAKEEEWQTIMPSVSGGRTFRFTGLPKHLPDETFALQIRYRVRATPLPADEICRIRWVFRNPVDGAILGATEIEAKNAQTHQFLVKKDIIVDGEALVEAINPVTNRYMLRFDGDGSLEILYRVGSFQANYVKAAILILLRLAFLSAIGLFFGTFVSFPVACFCGFTWYLISLGRPFWLESIGVGLTYGSAKDDPLGVFGTLLRPILSQVVPVLFPDFVAYNGVPKLVQGMAVENQVIAHAVLHMVVLGGLLLFVIGWYLFRRREVAEVTV